MYSSRRSMEGGGMSCDPTCGRGDYLCCCSNNAIDIPEPNKFANVIMFYLTDERHVLHSGPRFKYRYYAQVRVSTDGKMELTRLQSPLGVAIPALSTL